MRYFTVFLCTLMFTLLLACGHSDSPDHNPSAQPEKIESTTINPVPQATAGTTEETARETDMNTIPNSSDTEARKLRVAQKKVVNQSPTSDPNEPESPLETEPVAPEVPNTETVPAAESKPSADSAPTIPQTEEATFPPKEEAPEENAGEEPEKMAEKMPDHSVWDALLRKYVSAKGKVNYAGFKSDKARLQTYLDELAANPIQEKWSRAEKMAYWINVYNAFTVKLIVDNYPVSSITNLHGGDPWEVKWIKLGNRTYSLNEVENDILRPKYQDARIHFAVNCAARSCPPLLNRAWTGAQLNTLLEQQTRAFINNPAYNTISSRKVDISKIFEWYATDFGDLIEFLNKYSETRINKGARITYKTYDWALNE